MTLLAGDARTLAHEAYIYLYPLVLMDVTRQQTIGAAPGRSPMTGPPNAFRHIRAFPAADFRAVVRPNFDTLYSSAWLDLTAGPVLLRAEDTGDRYFMLPMLDMWTDVFACPGKRTTGTGAQVFVVAGPGPRGELPDGVPVIAAPTPWVWVIGRTQTNGPDDYAAVHRVQDGFTISPLAESTPEPPPADVDLDTEPLRLVAEMGAADFFVRAAGALAINPPHPTDQAVLARIALLGIVPGEAFDPARADDEVEAGVADARAALQSALPTLVPPINGWASLTETMGVYGNAYRRRAVIGLVGLGANPPEDAVYPLLMADADGAAVTGDRDYVLHFDADALPPVDAFWSVTMYDAEGYQAPNELDRFAIGDRDPLVFNDDGSLDIWVQHEHPGAEREANWLPAPRGPVGITMRLYAPRGEVLDGRWNPPPLRRA